MKQNEIIYIFIVLCISLIVSAHILVKNTSSKNESLEPKTTEIVPDPYVEDYLSDKEVSPYIDESLKTEVNLEEQCKNLCEHALDCMFKKLLTYNKNYSYYVFENSPQYRPALLSCVYDCAENMTEGQRACWTDADCSQIKSEQGLSGAVCKE